MASSMPGERRWAQTRKSGMTVLGKVPKPINLPSQRLENHGLDPNVEIVPKGTLTWGRPSSTGTNAWGTSSLSSPHADGSAGSPSFVSGRPSSGGSGTRPSTAGSDGSHDPVSNAWGPNSRPSSASGILASGQLSTALTRPRSADTRPGSSQLSRFAESSADNAVAWGATGTAERLGTVSSKTGGFTLSSGDFPTLGSEKSCDSHSQRGHSSQGRPTSASGTVSTPKETLEPNLAGNRNIDHSEHANVNTWRAENHPCVGDAAPPYWHNDPQQAPSYPNVNMPPRQFDSWHNPPLHPADGTWYGSGAPVGPYRPPGPPGSYFDYPHVSARPFPLSQAGPRPEGSSAVYRPNNVEQYHPHLPPESYMGPGHSKIPLRPGPYPGPVPYEGYYGPQKGFYNSSEKGPVISMVHPVVYNQYPTQNPNLDPGRYHDRPGGYITATNEEQMKADHAHESQGQVRVLLKQHDGWEDREVHGKREQSAMANTSHLERGNQPGLLRQEGDWRTKNQKPGPVSLSPSEADSSLDTSGLDSRSSFTVMNSIEDSRIATDNSLIGREEMTNLRVRDRQQYPAMKKNTLMEKGGDLNIRARCTVGQNELGLHSLKDRTKSKGVTSVSDKSSSTVNLQTSNEAILVTNKLIALTEEKNREPSSDEKIIHAPSNPVEAGENTNFQDQKRVHNVKGIDHRGKSKSSRHDNDEWIQKSLGSDPLVTTGVSGKGGPGASPLECAASLGASENHGMLHAASAGDGSYSASSMDSVDHKAQRAKLKEIALQRAKQLQQQEEERTREQKAKALAKLEELNKRTLAESSNQKLSHSPPPSSDVQNNNQESGACAPSKTDMNPVQAPADNLACDSKAVTLADDDALKDSGGSIDVSSDVVAQASDSAIQTSNILQNQSLTPSQETASKTIIPATASDSHDTSSKQKQLGYRRQGVSQDKSMGEKQITSLSAEASKTTGEVAISTSTSDTSANNDDNSVHHRKRNSRGSRNNKNKLDDVLPSSPSPHIEGISGKLQIAGKKGSPSVLEAEALSVPCESLNETVVTQTFREVSVIPMNQGSSESNEESHARGSNQWKPHAKKFSKNHQSNKPGPKYHGGSETVIWAPVKPLNKIEPSEDVSKNIVTEATYPSGKSGQDTQSVMKAKRAEIERYVPKPVAKELSQQVNSQQRSPSTQTGPYDMTGKPDSLLYPVEHGRGNEVSVRKANFSSDSRNGENIKHKNGKPSASWRQRSSTGPPSAEGPISSNSIKGVQKDSDQLQPSIDDSVPKGQLTHIDDGWNDNNDSLPPLVSIVSNVAAKNVGVNRHRRQPYKVQRVPGTTYPTDNVDVHRGMADKSEYRSPATGLNDSIGGKIMSTESQNAIGEHARPHWQPKSQANSHHGRQGNRGGSVGGQRVSAQGTENNDVQNEHKDVPNPRSVTVEARAPHYQEGKRERIIVADLSRENRSVDFAAGVNPQHQQPVTFGDTQRGNYGNRFQRGQESGHKGKDLRKDGSHLAFQQFGEPHQQDPVSGGSHEGPRASGSRYRERGRHHSRGGVGQFYGQSSGPARVSAYNNGE